MWRNIHSLWLGLFLLGSPAFSHPVAFKGAWSFMAFNQPDMLDWQLLYSFERKFSLGVDFVREEMVGPERYFLIPRLSWLVQRWNGKEYQANIYVYAGVGAARRDSDIKLAGEASVEADYETRKYYVSGKGTWIGARDQASLVAYQLRAGFAPYLADFEGIHSWLIAQAQYYPLANEENLRVGPVLRVFYRNVLWEMGVSVKGTWNINLMVHF